MNKSQTERELIEAGKQLGYEVAVLKVDNAKLRGALLEMLTAHGTATVFFGKRECTCHACTNARKLLSGE